MLKPTNSLTRIYKNTCNKIKTKVYPQIQSNPIKNNMTTQGFSFLNDKTPKAPEGKIYDFPIYQLTDKAGNANDYVVLGYSGQNNKRIENLLSSERTTGTLFFTEYPNSAYTFAKWHKPSSIIFIAINIQHAVDSYNKTQQKNSSPEDFLSNVEDFNNFFNNGDFRKASPQDLNREYMLTLPIASKFIPYIDIIDVIEGKVSTENKIHEKFDTFLKNYSVHNNKLNKNKRIQFLKVITFLNG
jgi:hypothetical protein